jgi:hypothetical protein
MSRDIFVWPEPIRLADAARASSATPLRRRLSADDAARRKLAKALDLVSVDALDAELSLCGWFDGVQIEAAWTARITQTCGLTLEAFSTDLAGEFELKLVPPGSRHAPTEPEAEIIIDLEAEDPPEVLEGDMIDLGAYVIEHMALEVDPFPRKPDAVFEPPIPTAEISPFAALRALRRADESEEG